MNSLVDDLVVTGDKVEDKLDNAVINPSNGIK